MAAASPEEKGNKRKYNMWSVGEQSKFLEGLTLFRRNFLQIADHIGTKDYSQVCCLCLLFFVVVFLLL